MPPDNLLGDILYENGAVDICPSLDSPDRNEARNVMQRWRALTDADQQAVINFLKAL